MNSFLPSEKVSSQFLFEKFADLWIQKFGELSDDPLSVSGPSPSLVFISKTNDLTQALQSESAKTIIIDAKLVGATTSTTKTIFATRNIRQVMAQVLPYFDGKFSRWHNQAPLQTSKFTMGKGVTISQGCVISEGVVIGNNVVLAPYVVLEKNCSVGDNSYLHPFVVIGENCQVGQNCEIYSHSVIGSGGFGFSTESQVHKKIAQVGRVVIEDDVVISALCTIDRATLSETRIGRGTKLDSHSHVAHNCSIGPNAIMAAGFMMAGSCHIGSNFTAAGAVVMQDHVRVGDNVIIGGRSAVTRDTLKSGAYTGYPLEPFDDGLRTLANLRNLTNMRKQIAKITKFLKLDQEKPDEL